MSIILFEHNQEAYIKLIEMYKTSNRAAIVHPTGSGKSYIPLKFMEDNPNAKILYLSPSVQILHQIKKNIFSSGMTMQNFKNLKRMTYQKLIRLSAEEMEELKPDMIVFDEFHHLGAPEWGAAVEELLALNPNAKILGLSATPMRYSDGEVERDMALELFDGHVASEMTLEEAIERGIYRKPEYTVGLYAYQEIIEELEQKVEDTKDEERKQQAIKELGLLKNMLQEATTSLPQLLESSMKNKNGKYIVYCRNIEDMQEKMAKAHEMFQAVNPNIEIMSISSDESVRQNEAVLNSFEANDDPKKLKLLFSVNMLNEGYHLRSIDGVIMMRPTHSPTLFAQQLGRALSVGSDKTPVVIDLVNNIDSIRVTEGFFGSPDTLEEKAAEQPNDKNIRLASFGIYKGYREIKTLIDKIDGLTGRQNFSNQEKLEVLKRFAITGEKMYRSTVFEGHPMYSWRTDVRNAYKNNLLDISKEDEEQLLSLGVLTIPTPTNEEKAKRICQWIEEHGNKKLPARNNRADEENLLGTWLSFYRTKNTEEERLKYVQINPYAAEVFAKIDLVAEYNRQVSEERAQKICEWITAHGDEKLPKRSSKDAEESLLGLWTLVYTSRLEKEKRESFIKENPYAAAVFEKIDLIETKTRNQRSPQLRNLQALETWFLENGSDYFPPMQTLKDEKENEANRKYLIIRHRISKFINAASEQELQELIDLDSEGATIFYAIQRMQKEVAQKYLGHVLNAKNWCEKDNTFDLPRIDSENSEERKIACRLRMVTRNVSKYFREQNEEEKKEFEELHPDINEIIDALNSMGIDSKDSQKRTSAKTQEDVFNERIQSNLKKAKLYKGWIQSHPQKDKPSREKPENEEEKSIAIMYSSLMQVYVRPYLKLQTDDEREKYLRRYPEILDVIAILNEADEVIENHKKMRVIQRARAIKTWIEENTESTTLPSKANGGEIGNFLGNEYWNLKATYVKPYIECSTEEEKQLLAKRKAGTIDVVTILSEIDAELESRKQKRSEEKSRIELEKQDAQKAKLTPLERLKKIRTWVAEHDYSRTPIASSKDEIEASLGRDYRQLRAYYINPYLSLEGPEKNKYAEDHPEITEMVDVLYEIEEQTGKTNVPTHLKHIRRVKFWYDEQGKKTLPKYYTPSSEEEKKLAACYRKAKDRIVKPYMKLETEEQRRAFEQKHPELPEIVFTMQGMEEQTEDGVSQLIGLVLEYWETRGFLEEAKKLEAEYKDVLKRKEGERRQKGDVTHD